MFSLNIEVFRVPLFCCCSLAVNVLSCTHDFDPVVDNYENAICNVPV